MSAAVCPNCNRPLAPSVLAGPAQAVVRCEGCQTLLLWSNGRVMRSARSATPTVMGMPAMTAPAKPNDDVPLTALRPEAEATKNIPPPAKPPVTRTATTPAAKPGATGMGDNVPTRVTQPPPELRKAATPPTATPKPAAPSPMKTSSSGPIAMPPSPPPKPGAPKPTLPAPAPKPAAPMKAAKTAPSGPIATRTPEKPPLKEESTAVTGRPEAKAESNPEAKAESKADAKPSLVAAVAEVPSAGNLAGPMVDPAAWFQDPSDVVPPEKAVPLVESAKEPRRDSTGAQPLPPPPSLKPLPPAEPFVVNAPVDEPPPREEPSAMIPLEPEGMKPAAEAEVFEVEASDEPTDAFADKPAARPAVKATMMGIAAPTRPAPAKPNPPSPPAAASLPSPMAPMAKSRSGQLGLTPPAKAEPKDKTPAPNKATQVGHAVSPSSLPSPSSSPLSSSPSSSSSSPSPMAPKAAATAPTLMVPSPEPVPPMETNAPRPIIAGDTSAPDLPPPPQVLRPPSTAAHEETEEIHKFALSLSPRARVMVATGAGAAVLLGLVVWGVGHLASRPTLPAKPPLPTPITVAVPKPTSPAPMPSAAPPPSKPSPPVAATPEPAPPPSEEPSEPAAPRASRSRHTLGGKKVVLEYDTKPTSPAPPPATAPVPSGEDPATVARAREAYHKGNVKLFSGDTEGAIASYRESLKIYPGYVAGYRGLGLGYEQGGHTQEALSALRTYVRTVPNAHDVALIKKRIEHLEAKQ